MSVTSNVLARLKYLSINNLSMLEYLIQLPYDFLGQNMLGFLNLIDIIQLENGATSHKSQKLLKAILPYCPPIRLSDSFNQVCLKTDALNWFHCRLCRIKFVRIDFDSLCEVNFEHFIMENIELCLKKYATLRNIESLPNQYIDENVSRVMIRNDQDPAVMEVLFSMLSSVRSLHIQSANLTEWMMHLKQLGPCLRELTILSVIEKFTLSSIIEYCPYLEKLYLSTVTDVSQSILQCIAYNCPHLLSLEINTLSYNTKAAACADLTALAEKCPQLEELSLTCQQLTDQSMIALAQHCSRLKKLNLMECDLSTMSLIALSERSLSLEELNIIPGIPISSAEIAVQCVHTLSRILELSTNSFSKPKLALCYAIQYMTGLCNIHFDNPEDHLLLPHLLLLLQRQCCAGLETMIISDHSSITPEQLCELVALCPHLHTVQISKVTCNCDAVLVELARSCPHLQYIAMYNIGKVTEEGILALIVSCRYPRELDIYKFTVTEETVRQLAQHCRRLTKLNLWVYVKKGEVMVERCKYYSSKEIRTLRE